ncbi:Microtubule-associated serine/threonine-protein kinase 3 [Geodia barretti]|nr:Microtubule-associated serine/threonine-protein kinase 3 [Geodia barretti]
MLDEGEKTPEPLQQMPTSPPPSITTHSYTAASCLSQRRSGLGDDISQISIADITVCPPTPGVVAGVQDSGSSSSVAEASPLSSPRHSQMVTSTYAIKRGPSGYGMILKAIRVYIGQTDDYRIHHIIEKVDKKGPAWEAGLRKGCLVTHINGQSVIGLHHIQVMKLMIDKHNSFLYINTIPLEDTSIRKDKKKRLPTLGHRVGKLFRHRSSGSGRIKKKSFISRMRGRDRKGVDSSGHSSSSTPSPKHSSSPARTESFKQKLVSKMTPRRRPTPVSPLARSTSPVSLAQIITPNSSPPGSVQNLSSASFTTPPNSPPIYTKRLERHSVTESQLVMHKKSQSACELPTPKHPSPHTSPLLQRAMSPGQTLHHSPSTAQTQDYEQL